VSAESLEERVAKLELEVIRAKAFGDIISLMSRMQYLHTSGKNHLIHKEIFAKKAQDIRLHFGEMGWWEGHEAVEIQGQPMEGMPDTGENPRTGAMAQHLMMQPCIEVAADGKTAQATFWAAGLMAGKDRKTGEASCSWEWNRYGEDYIYEDGQWKLWRHHVYPLFRIGQDQTWADAFKKNQNDPGGFEMKMNEKLKKYWHPATPADRFYDPHEVLPDIPVPEPYETWDEKQSYSYI